MLPRRNILAAAVILLAASSARADQPAAVTVLPAAIDIRHHRHPHAVQVLGTTADGFSLDLRGAATFTSADPKVATVDGLGWVRPVATGETSVTVRVAGQTKTVPVKVTLPAAEPPTSFRHEVMPVLTRAGCNAGACHGYSLGKNGFKLSLRGADPSLDYRAVVRDTYGRRLDFQDPDASLVLAKARGDVPHEGGARFPRGSLSDEILSSWVRAGAPGDLEDRAEVVGV